MAIGALIISANVAFFGSIYLSLLHRLNFLEGMAVYSLLGCMAMIAILAAAIAADSSLDT